MKKTLILCLCMLLGACTTTVSRKPILQSSEQPSTITFLNGFADEFATIQLGRTVLGNKSSKRETSDWDVPQYINSGLIGVFNQVNGINVKNLELTKQEQEYLHYINDSQVSYEKKINNIPGILEKAKSQGIDQIVIASPSIITMPNSGVVISGIGLWFGAGLIEPYSAINLHFIDTATSEIIGKHELNSFGEPVKLINDLTDTEIRS